MPWRFILTIVLLILVLVFVGLNLDNRTTISFGVYTLEDVRVAFALSFAFFLGVVVTIPFTLLRRGRKEKKGMSGDDSGKETSGEVPEKK